MSRCARLGEEALRLFELGQPSRLVAAPTGPLGADFGQMGAKQRAHRSHQRLGACQKRVDGVVVAEGNFGPRECDDVFKLLNFRAPLLNKRYSTRERSASGGRSMRRRTRSSSPTKNTSGAIFMHTALPSHRSWSRRCARRVFRSERIRRSSAWLLAKFTHRNHGRFMNGATEVSTSTSGLSSIPSEWMRDRGTGVSRCTRAARRCGGRATIAEPRGPAKL